MLHICVGFLGNCHSVLIFQGCLLVASAEALLASLFTLSCQHSPVLSGKSSS